MSLKELIEKQNFFLEVVHSDPSQSTRMILEMPEAQVFVEKTAHRLQAYRTSYYARVSCVFSETIFNLASYLFGKEMIKSFLIDYFYKNPSPAEMIESVRGFACYLEDQEETKECHFIPDFIRLCTSINDILSAKNPEESLFLKNVSEIPNPSKIFLQDDHIFLKSKWPIYQMYCAAKELNDMMECSEKKTSSECNLEKEREEKFLSIINKEESIFLLKSSPWSLESILVPNEFISIADNLNTGMSLEDSIENTNIDENSFDTQKFSNWISLLTKHKAFIKRI